MNKNSKKKVKYTGGDGFSIETAIKIHDASTGDEGVAAEYDYINKNYGEENKVWKFISQALITQNGIGYDQINVLFLRSKKKKSFYFDTSEFFCKGTIADQLFGKDIMSKLYQNDGNSNDILLQASMDQNAKININLNNLNK